MPSKSGVFAALQAVLSLAYPGLIYFGMNRLGAPATALASAALALALALLVRAKPASEIRRFELAWPFLGLLLPLLSITTESATFLLLWPTVANLLLFVVFFASLRGPTPIVERFARAYVSDLSPLELSYCRKVTYAWCAFFTLNGATALLLALYSPLSLWTLYNGVIVYFLIGAFFMSEYVLRKYKFRRFSQRFHDRCLQRLLPAAKVRQT